MRCLSPVTIKNPNFNPDSADPRVAQEPRYIEVPCGKCYNCLRTRANEWVFRLNVEMRHNLCAIFLTLTYDDDHLPKDGSLCYKHVQDYYKRLRKHVVFRHFTIGEYGPENLRPHYHAVIFGLSRYDEVLLTEKWPHGFVKIGDVSDASINYVAGYCCKNQVDYESLGLARQFTRCSIKPPIGSQYEHRASELILKKKQMLLAVPVMYNGYLDTITRSHYLTWMNFVLELKSTEFTTESANLLLKMHLFLFNENSKSLSRVLENYKKVLQNVVISRNRNWKL